jgi:hypothetical protein
MKIVGAAVLCEDPGDSKPGAVIAERDLVDREAGLR